MLIVKVHFDVENKLANHLAATPCIEACRRDEGDLLLCKVSIRM